MSKVPQMQGIIRFLIHQPIGRHGHRNRGAFHGDADAGKFFINTGSLLRGEIYKINNHAEGNFIVQHLL